MGTHDKDRGGGGGGAVVVVVVMLMMLEIIPTSPVSFYGCFAAILTINPHLKYFDAVSTFVF